MAKKNKTVLDEAEELLDDSGLTERNKIFCREYIFDWNATRSYTIAYPDVNSPEAARAAASRLLTNVNVKAYIELIQKDLEKLAGISRMKVISEHAKMAFSSIAHLHNTWITRKEFNKLTDEQKACIKSIESSVETKNIGGRNAANQKFIDVETVKITLYDKQKSLDAINKMLGYDAPIKFQGELTIPQLPDVIIR
jgi:phage terminase small subunit